MIAAALSFALLSGLWPHHKHAPHAPPPQNPYKPSHGRSGDWRYEIKIDNFTGERACTLRGRDHKSKIEMTYFNGVVAFRFPYVDVADAVYRVDYGEPRASLNQAEGNLGWVFIPAASLAHAQQVLVRPSPNVLPKTVALKGLDETLATTTALGCTPEAFAQPSLTD